MSPKITLTTLVASLIVSIATMAAAPPQRFGVNISGPESTGSNLPGTYAYHYVYPTDDELDYYKAHGITLIRLPFRWERV